MTCNVNVLLPNTWTVKTHDSMNIPLHTYIIHTHANGLLSKMSLLCLYNQKFCLVKYIRISVILSLQHLGLLAQDLYNIKSVDIPSWIGGGAHKAPPQSRSYWQLMATGKEESLFFRNDAHAPVVGSTFIPRCDCYFLKEGISCGDLRGSGRSWR